MSVSGIDNGKATNTKQTVFESLTKHDLLRDHRLFTGNSETHFVFLENVSEVCSAVHKGDMPA